MLRARAAMSARAISCVVLCTLFAPSLAGIHWNVSSLWVRHGDTVHVAWSNAPGEGGESLQICHGTTCLSSVPSASVNGTTGELSIRLYNMRLGNYTVGYLDNNNRTIATSPDIAFVHGVAEPTFIHTSMGSDAESIRIAWVSGVNDTPIAWYRVGESAEQLEARAVTTTYNETDLCEPPSTQPGAWIAPGYLHVATLPRLPASTTVHYIVGDASHPDASSSELSLLTPPPNGRDPQRKTTPSPWSFIVVADMGHERPYCDTCVSGGRLPFGPRAAATVDRIVREELTSPEGARIVLHVGDISYACNNAMQWDVFGHTVQALASRIPYHVSVGNHEYVHKRGGAGGKDPSGVQDDAGFHPPWGDMDDDSYGECGVPTARRFPVPAAPGANGVFWYSFDVSNVHFVMLSSEHDPSPGSPLALWLEADLARVDRSITPWVIVSAHRPLYTSERDEDDHRTSEGIRARLEPLMQQYSVDIFFSGHFHSYERTAPVFQNRVQGTYDDPQATIHICAGTAGIGVDVDNWYETDWSIKRIASVYAYGRARVLNDTDLQWDLVESTTGIVLDSVVVRSSHKFR